MLNVFFCLFDESNNFTKVQQTRVYGRKYKVHFIVRLITTCHRLLHTPRLSNTHIRRRRVSGWAHSLHLKDFIVLFPLTVGGWGQDMSHLETSVGVTRWKMNSIIRKVTSDRNQMFRWIQTLKTLSAEAHSHLIVLFSLYRCNIFISTKNTVKT